MSVLLGGIVRRALLGRLVRYRVAWLGCGVAGLYLALAFALIINARQQTTRVGTFDSCSTIPTSASGTTTYNFTLRQAPGLRWQFAPDALTPAVPAHFCWATYAVVTYETDPLQGPVSVDRLTLYGLPGQRVSSYTSPVGDNFVLAKRVTLYVWSGGTTLLSVMMLLVAACWRVSGGILRWLAGVRQGHAQARLPAAFGAQVRVDLHWLAALPWGASAGDEGVEGAARFARGIALVRGWQRQEDTLLDGAALLIQCPPALAYAGAAEVALQFAAYGLTTWSPAGARAALTYADRGLACAPNAPDALVARVQALAALGAMGDGDALRSAAHSARTLAAVAPDHPRLPAAVATIYLAGHQYAAACTALGLAIERAPSPDEAAALRAQLTRAQARAGRLRHAPRITAAPRAERDTASLPTLARV